jgi:phospholipid/cholesterol/gamma-HCH transport system substrate-binding protein
VSVFDERVARRVGVVVMALVAAAAAAVLLVDCSRLRPGIQVTIYYTHIASLEEGADVQIAGRRVGRVTGVQLLPARAVRDPGHPLHPGGGVAVHVRLEKRYAEWASTDSDCVITAKGVLGEPYIEIGPGAVERTGRRGLRDGDQLRGADPARMDQVLVKSFQNMSAFRALLDEVAPAARELRDALARLERTLRDIEPEPGAYAVLGDSLARFDASLDALTGGWRAAGVGPGDLRALVRAAGEFADRARGELAQVGAALDRLAADLERVRGSIPPGLADRLERALATARLSAAKLERVIATGQELAARVESGHGTIGALMNDPEFIDDAKQLGKILKREPWRVIGHPSKEALEKQR